MSENIHKSHNVSKLMYHFVFPTKYRRVVVSEDVERVIKETCIEISNRYELYFLEIGMDKDHVHFLAQAAPKYSPTQIVKIVKSITAREVFIQCPEVKKKLWGGNFWSSGYYVATVSEHGNEAVIANYVKNQGNEYKKLYRNEGIKGKCCERRRRSRAQCLSACTGVVDWEIMRLLDVETFKAKLKD